MYCSMPKGTCRAEATSNSEKNQARSLSYACLKALVSQSFSQKKKKNSIVTLSEAFLVVLGTLLGLILPNQYCQAP